MRKFLSSILVLSTLGLAGCNQSNAPSTEVEVASSQKSLSQQAVCPSWEAARRIEQVDVLTQYPTEVTGRLSAVTLDRLKGTNYYKAGLMALNLSSSESAMLSTAIQSVDNAGNLSIAMRSPLNEKALLYFNMTAAKHVRITPRYYKCGVLVRTEASYVENNYYTAVGRLETIAYKTIGADTLLSFGRVAPDVTGLLTGQSLSTSTSSSHEDAVLFNSNTGTVIADYNMSGLSLARASSGLTAQSIVVVEVPPTDPKCNQDTSTGAMSGQSIIVCPAENSPEVTSPIEASTSKTNAYKCADAYDDWQADVHAQNALAWTTVAALGTGVGSVGAIIFTSGVAAPVAVAGVFGGITGAGIAYENWKSQTYKTSKSRRAYNTCLSNNNVT